MAEPQTPDETDEAQAAPSQEQEAPSAETPAVTPPEDSKSFPEEYVKELRSESAGYRKRAQEAETKLKEYEQAQMSELEKAQTIATEAAERASQLENQLQAERVRNAVVLTATEMSFLDPSDALNLIDLQTLNFDEETGRPSTKSVKGALERLANAKPYLVGSKQPGSADGGARGEPGELTREEKIAGYGEQIQQRFGGVPIPR